MKLTYRQLNEYLKNKAQEVGGFYVSEMTVKEADREVDKNYLKTIIESGLLSVNELVYHKLLTEDEVKALDCNKTPCCGNSTCKDKFDLRDLFNEKTLADVLGKSVEEVKNAFAKYEPQAEELFTNIKNTVEKAAKKVEKKFNEVIEKEKKEDPQVDFSLVAKELTRFVKDGKNKWWLDENEMTLTNKKTGIVISYVDETSMIVEIPVEEDVISYLVECQEEYVELFEAVENKIQRIQDYIEREVHKKQKQDETLKKIHRILNS